MKLPLLPHFLKRLSGHRLHVVQEGAVTAYYLRQDNERSMSTLLTFGPEGIAIQGDLTPENIGSLSRGYGLAWFTGELEPDYLVKKFLTKRWVRELAAEQLRDRNYMGTELWTPTFVGSPARPSRPLPQAERIKRKSLQAEFNRIADEIDYYGPEMLREDLQEAGWDCSDGVPGYGYEPGEAAWLVAIQQTFARLYRERQEEFYILDDKPVAGTALWWRANDKGYTTHLADAGRYTRAQIDAEPNAYNNGEVCAIPCSKVDPLAYLIVSDEAARKLTQLAAKAVAS